MKMRKNAPINKMEKIIFFMKTRRHTRMIVNLIGLGFLRLSIESGLFSKSLYFFRKHITSLPTITVSDSPNPLRKEATTKTVTPLYHLKTVS